MNDTAFYSSCVVSQGRGFVYWKTSHYIDNVSTDFETHCCSHHLYISDMQPKALNHWWEGWSTEEEL